MRDMKGSFLCVQKEIRGHGSQETEAEKTHDIFMTLEADGGRKKWEKKSGNMGELMGDKGKK